MIIVDCLKNNGVLPIENLVPILKWENDPNDHELKYLTKYLIHLTKVDDCSIMNFDHFKLEELSYEKY